MKKRFTAAVLLIAAIISAGFFLYKKSLEPKVTVLSTDTIDYEITKQYIPDSKEKQIIVKYSENGYETIIAIGLGDRTTSVRNFETNAYDMYMTEEHNPLFVIDKYPSDEEIIAEYIDFSNDKLLGHYGEPFPQEENPDTPVVSVPADYPAIDIITDENALLSANILTEIITPCVMTYSTPLQPEFNYMRLMTGLSFREDENFCYYNIFPIVGYDTQFKISNMEKVMRQLMGDYDWNGLTDFGQPPNGGYNEATMCYEFSTDFGWGMQSYYTGDFIYSEFASGNTQVISHFELFGPVKDSPDPDHQSYGNYRLVYDIVSEGGETFLRFSRYEKE